MSHRISITQILKKPSIETAKHWLRLSKSLIDLYGNDPRYAADKQIMIEEQVIVEQYLNHNK